MTKHNRRENYWPYYELAKERDREHLKATLIEVIDENPCPRPKGSNRGRPPEHSKEKLDFVCLWMMANNDTYRDAEADLREMKTPWDNEPVPDHTTICRHMKEIPPDWLDLILAETARRCMAAAGDAIGPLGSDSSGVATTRYETPGSSDSETEQSRRREYGKYHITAILGLQIILAAFYTTGNVHDSRMLVPMFDKIKRLGFDFSGLIFNADGAYDMEYIFEYIFWRRMFPNIKQRKGSTNRNKTPKRKKAAEGFNSAEYAKRLLIEGVFGAEETRRYQLHCRFVLEKNRILFAKGRAIAWNIRVLNRFECANRLHIPIPSYGGVAHTVCA